MVIFGLCLSYFLVLTNLTVFTALIPFIGRDLGMSALQATLLVSSFPACSCISNLIVGRWVDKFGARRSIFVGSAGCAICFLLASIAGSSSIQILLRCLGGLLMPLVGAAVFVGTTEISTLNTQKRNISLVQAAGAAANVVSVPLAIFISGAYSWRFFLFGLALLSASIACISLLFLTKRTTTTRSSDQGPQHSSLFRNHTVVGLATCYAGLGLGTFIVLGIYPTWLLEKHSEAAARVGGPGVIFLIAGIGSILGPLLSGAVLHQSRPFKAGFVLSCVTAASAGAIWFTGSPIFLILGFPVFMTLRSTIIFIIVSAANSSVSSDVRGRLNGLFNATYQAAASIGIIVSVHLYKPSQNFFGESSASAFAFSVVACVFIYLISSQYAAKTVGVGQ